MLKKEIYLKNISKNLAQLSNEVKILNAINLYDINIVGEDFYAGLLNLVYGYELKNANSIQKNAKAIDLIDKTNRITIQVTSDNSSTKIKHTISEYNEEQLYNTYDRLVILILTSKKNYTANFNINNNFVFDAENDIWSVEDIIKEIRTLEVSKIKKINNYIEEEFCDKLYSVKMTQSNEIDTIIDLIEFISNHKEVKKIRETFTDPDFKIYQRFREFADRLVSEYTSLYMVYGEAITVINDTFGIDEAQEIVIMFFLQDISLQYLDQTSNDPVAALNKLVDYFEIKLGSNGKKYDRVAIKFYLINEMIKCNVFPNERSDENAN